jgi:hypothetical protein
MRRPKIRQPKIRRPKMTRPNIRWPNWRDIPGIALVVALLSFLLYWQLTHPFWQQPTGFGPEWQCTQSGRAAADFCYKKPPAVRDGNSVGRSD